MTNAWTLEEIKILKKEYKTRSTRELMQLFPRHPKSSIHMKASRLGITGEKPSRTNTYTNDELLQYLKDFHRAHGRAPRQNETGPKKGMPSFLTYAKRFGSWSRALGKIK